MSGFASVAPTTALKPGLYKVVIPLVLLEVPAMSYLARSDTAWKLAIKSIETGAMTRHPTMGWSPGFVGGFHFKMPRTNRLDLKTGLDSINGTVITKKGYTSKREFWCLIAVTSVTTGAKTEDLWKWCLLFTPGLLGPRVPQLPPVKYYRYVVDAPVVTPNPVYTTPSTPKPTTGVTPIPVTSPGVVITPPTPTVTVPAPGATKPKPAPTAPVAAAKAATAKVTKTVQNQPLAVLAGVGAGYLFFLAYQRRNR